MRLLLSLPTSNRDVSSVWRSGQRLVFSSFRCDEFGVCDQRCRGTQSSVPDEGPRSTSSRDGPDGDAASGRRSGLRRVECLLHGNELVLHEEHRSKQRTKQCLFCANSLGRPSFLLETSIGYHILDLAFLTLLLGRSGST